MPLVCGDLELVRARTSAWEQIKESRDVYGYNSAESVCAEPVLGWCTGVVRRGPAHQRAERAANATSLAEHAQSDDRQQPIACKR